YNLCARKSRDAIRAAAEFYTELLPREVGEGLVGVGHAVDVLALGEGGPFLVVGSRKLFGQLQKHGPALLFAHRPENPANRQRLLPVAVDLHRHLVRGTADAAAANLDERLHVLDRSRENLDRVLVWQLFLDHVQGRIKYILCHALFAVVHQAIDELGREERFELRIGTERRGASGNLAHETSKLLGLLGSVSTAGL